VSISAQIMFGILVVIGYLVDACCAEPAAGLIFDAAGLTVLTAWRQATMKHGGSEWGSKPLPNVKQRT
jgi:hypothetical protein